MSFMRIWNIFLDFVEKFTALYEATDDLVHKYPQFVPILKQMKIFHAISSSFFKTCVNIILQSTPRSSKFSLSPDFRTKPCINILYTP